MTAQRIQLGPFFDQGMICPAAQLEHYDAGTTNLRHIWSDSAETTQLAQPFISDANGVFNFFASGNYKIIIKKSDGQVLHTLDNWKIIDVSQPSLSAGSPVSTASDMSLGDATWAHWTGSANVQTLSGTALFYWAVADGNFTLVHSASVLCPDSRNRKILAGDVLFFIKESTSIWRLSAHMQKEGGWTGRQCTSVAASATLTVPADGDFIDVSGGTTITAISLASSGYRFRARFTGTGLNLTHNGTSLISPWGRDYRTVQNEILEFQSLGAGNWIFYSLNGPKERVGTIITHDGPTTPAGFLARDGSTVSRTTYSGLFQEYGTTHGVGDGSTTFGLPDGRGRFDLQIDGAANRVTSASTNGANADTLGGTGGAQTHTLAESEIPTHTHSVGAFTGTVDGGGAGSFQVRNGSTASGSTGGGGAHNTMPPWIATNKYIRF
jgi:hypothetical protein